MGTFENKEGWSGRATSVPLWLAKKVFQGEWTDSIKLHWVKITFQKRDSFALLDNEYLKHFFLEDQDHIVIDENNKNHIDFLIELDMVPQTLLKEYLIKIGFDESFPPNFG
ncbi:MAG: hypothetical protein JST96_09950 [Bacteroidetes bacterium]|nr:hypothetical protein [Bacteroidota bacterium]